MRVYLHVFACMVCAVWALVCVRALCASLYLGVCVRAYVHAFPRICSVLGGDSQFAWAPTSMWMVVARATADMALIYGLSKAHYTYARMVLIIPRTYSACLYMDGR